MQRMVYFMQYPIPTFYSFIKFKAAKKHWIHENAQKSDVFQSAIQKLLYNAVFGEYSRKNILCATHCQ